jgi:hypothetical protein
MYAEALNQWRRELGHVANVPGGVYITEKMRGQEGHIYSPVPKAKQKEAVEFLGKTAFQEPTMFLADTLLGVLQSQGAMTNLQRTQKYLLRTVIASDKLVRLEEQCALQVGGNADSLYSVRELLVDVETPLFADVFKPAKNGKLSSFRTALQREYIVQMGRKLLPIEKPQWWNRNSDTYSADVRSVVRGQLIRLQKSLERAKKRGSLDQQDHVLDLIARIEAAFDEADD